MTNSTFGTSNYALLNKTAEYAGNSPKGKIKMEPQYDWYWAYGAGQIISTVDDMLKWDEALYNRDFMQPELLKIAHTSIFFGRFDGLVIIEVKDTVILDAPPAELNKVCNTFCFAS